MHVMQMRWWATAGALIVAATASPRVASAGDEADEANEADAADAADWGVQLGGPGVFEIMYRPRILGPVLLEVGAFLVGGGGFIGNASLGLAVEFRRPPSAQPYVAFGGGVVGGCGESEEGPGCSSVVFGYSRMGLALGVGPRQSNLVTLDVGGWYGAINNDERGYRRFIIPMAGVGYYW